MKMPMIPLSLSVVVEGRKKLKLLHNVAVADVPFVLGQLNNS